MDSQVLSLVIVLGALLASTQMHFKDPAVLNRARVLYISSNVIVLGAHVFTRWQIIRKKDTSIVQAYNTNTHTGNEPSKVTVYEYDLQQWNDMFKSHLISLAMVAIMHLYFGLPNPLIIQSVLPLKGMMESNLVRIHVFGQRPEGELKRPWEAKPGLVSFLKPFAHGFFGGVKSGKAGSQQGQVKSR